MSKVCLNVICVALPSSRHGETNKPTVLIHIFCMQVSHCGGKKFLLLRELRQRGYNVTTDHPSSNHTQTTPTQRRIYLWHLERTSGRKLSVTWHKRAAEPTKGDNWNRWIAPNCWTNSEGDYTGGADNSFSDSVVVATVPSSHIP